MEFSTIPEEFSDIRYKDTLHCREDYDLQNSDDDINLFCTESVEDLDRVWDHPEENLKDAFKLKPYQLKPVNGKQPLHHHPQGPPVYQVGDPPEENPYISYLVRQFQNGSNLEAAELPEHHPETESINKGADNHDISIIANYNPPSPLQERLTMVDSFNEVSMNDVIIFRDDSMIPYHQRSPRSSPGSSNNTSPRSMSPVSDHVVPNDDTNRVLRSCVDYDDHVVPDMEFIEE